MTAKEIKDYLRTEEKILWQELMKTERELEASGYGVKERTKKPDYMIKLAKWSIVWEINQDLGITEE